MGSDKPSISLQVNSRGISVHHVCQVGLRVRGRGGLVSMARGPHTAGTQPFREEFRLRKLGFEYDEPKHFYSCQWQWPPAVYISIRVFLSLYTTGALITVCAMNPTYTILRFLTIWTYILLALHFTVASVITITHHIKRPRSKNCSEDQQECKSRENPGFVDEEEMGRIQRKQPEGSHKDSKEEPEDNITWYMKLSWMLSDMVQVFSVIVTVIYFTAIYPTLTVTNSELFNDFNVHAVNTVFVLLDAAVCARPVRFLHLVYPLGYGLLYVVFSVVVYGVSGTVIYNVLDYSQPLYPAVTVPGLALIVIPLLQLAFYGLYRLRLRLSLMK